MLSCNSGGKGAFEISGTIKGAENAALLLETLSFPNMNGAPSFVTIDTVTAGADGSFHVEGNLKERSICRLKMVDNPAYYLLFNVEDEKITVNGSTDDPDPEITGSTATNVLVQFIGDLREKNTEIMDFSNQVLSQREVLGDSIFMLMQDRMDGMIDGYYKFITNFADTTTEVTNKIVALENLYYDNQFDLIKIEADKILANADTSSVYMKELADKVNRFQAMLDEEEKRSFIGKPAIDITLNDPNGKPVQLSSLKGKVVLLDFWASWCGPCRQENPNLVKAYNKFKDKGFTIYSVSLDDNQTAWTNGIKEDKLVWPYHVSELKKFNSTAASAYMVTGIPASFLIDSSGTIVAQNLRGQQLDIALTDLLGE
jgi:peroxiredoxin